MDIKQQTQTVVSSVNNIIKTGVKRSEELIRIASLKFECVRIDNTINSVYKQLGKSVYKMVKNDKPDADEIEKAVIQLEGLHLLLANTKKKIEAANRIVTCPMCKEKNRYIDEHCRCCGHKLFITDEAPEEYDE